MKVGTHYKMAKIAINRLHNSLADHIHFGIRAKLFCIGTILPDLSINQFIHRHFYPLSGNYIEMKIKRLAKSSRTGFIQALRAGAIAHYLSDFCCTVYASGGIGNVKEHLHYEREIHRYVKAKSDIFSEGHALINSFSQIHEEVFSQVESYHEQKQHGCATDVRACVQICENLYGFLFKKNEAEYTEISLAFEFDFPAGAEFF